MTKDLWVRGAQPASNFDHAIISSEVRAAFRRWVAATGSHGGIIIGDIALAFYARPRFTDNIELLYVDADAAPLSLPSFVRHESSTMIDGPTGTVIKLVVPDGNNLSSALATKVRKTSVSIEGTTIASLQAMIALKLSSATSDKWGGYQAKQDIINMVGWDRGFREDQMRSWHIDPEAVKLLPKLVSIARTS